MESFVGFLNNSNLDAILSTSLIINLQCVEKIYFATLGEVYNNVVPHWSTFLISCNQLITRLISFTKTVQIRARIFKRLLSPGIDTKELIPPAYVAWRAGTITLFLLGS
jgi:hypothetical protein